MKVVLTPSAIMRVAFHVQGPQHPRVLLLRGCPPGSQLAYKLCIFADPRRAQHTVQRVEAVGPDDDM